LLSLAFFSVSHISLEIFTTIVIVSFRAEKLLSLREDIAKKYCSVQNSYEKLYLDYNEARDKISELQNNEKLGENACRVETSHQSVQTDDDIDGSDGNTKTVVRRGDDAVSEASDVLDDITRKVKTILRNHTVSVEAEESIFEGIARQYVEAKWKLDVLEKKVTELTRNVKKVEEIRDILQLECEELQSHVHSLLLENQALKSNLPCIPEGSEERVASLETDVDSLRDEIKRFAAENRAMREMNSTLLRVAQGEKGPWTNHDQENEVCSSVEEEYAVSSAKNAANEYTTSTERSKLDYENVEGESEEGPSDTRLLRDNHAALRNTVDRLTEENKYLLRKNQQLDMQLRDKASQEREKNDRLLDHLRKELDAANHENSELRKDILYKSAELEEMRTRIEIKDSKIARINQDHERLIKETKSLSEQLIATHDESLDKIELLNTEMALLQQEYEDQKQKASIYKVELIQVKESLHEAQESNAKLENECYLLKREVCELREAERLQDRMPGMTREELGNEASSSRSLQESLVDERDFLQKRCEVLEREIQIFRAKETQFKQSSFREAATEVIAGDKADEEIKEFANSEDNLTRRKHGPVERATTERQDLTKEGINITFNESGRTLLSIIDEERREKDTLKAHNEKLLREIIELRNEFQIASENSKESAEMARQTIENLSHLVREKDEEISTLRAEIVRVKDAAAQASDELAAMRGQKSELEQLNAVKHNEGLQYRNEIQRLVQHANEQALRLQELTTLQRAADETREGQQLKNLQKSGETDESIDQSRQNAELAVLSEKCGALETALIQEQSNSRFLQNQLAESQKREANSAKELERLRTHLVEMESSYTEEALIAETSRQELEAKLLLAEEKVKSSSTAFTSANVRANQQVETLQQQIALITQQRDNIQAKLSATEDKILLQSASLTNLQVVLEQFQQGE